MPRFNVEYTVRGTVSATITAKTLQEANKIVEAKTNDVDAFLDLDEVSDIDWRISELHPVTRNGQKMWTTYVHPTDLLGHRDS